MTYRSHRHEVAPSLHVAPILEGILRDAGAESWITLPGRVADDELVELYRRAWVLASVSWRSERCEVRCGRPGGHRSRGVKTV